MPNSHRTRALPVAALLMICVVGCSDPTHSSVVVVASAGNNQTGTVATALPLPLQVTVEQDGKPLARASVIWTVPRGTILPQQSVTASDGIAAATWTLGTLVRVDTAYAQVGGVRAMFLATGLPGAAADITVWGVSWISDTSGARAVVTASVTDQYQNPVAGRWPVGWTVRSGPLKLVTADSITRDGGSTAIFAAQGDSGRAVVRAAIPGTQLSTDASLTVLSVKGAVILDNVHTLLAFVSMRNKSQPALDTVAVGETLRWVMGQFDYDVHSVVPSGAPAFQGGGDFPYYADPSVVSVTFTAPGTYHYMDSYHPSATGTVVVR